MSEAQSVGPSGESDIPQKKGVEKRLLNEQESRVEEVANKSVPHQSGREIQAVDVPREKVKEALQGERRTIPTSLPLQAVKSVEQKLGQAAPLQSIHDKWSPLFKSDIQAEAAIEQTDFKQRIINARGKIRRVKRMYLDIQKNMPSTPMRERVLSLLKTGSMQPIEGGKGGVYLLSDADGNPQFIIKPGDEAMLALNNNKGMASPYLDGDTDYAPVRGGCIYESVQNGELAYKAAEIFNLQEVTPQAEVMVINCPLFHDVMDGTKEDKQLGKEIAIFSPPSKEKVCLVQSFIPGCMDMGSLLAERSQIDQKELHRLFDHEREKYETIEKEHTPQDIDQTMFEKIALLSMIIGEKDGNAGNFLCKKGESQPNENRPVYKIDNGGAFAENNDLLRTGLCWIAHNYFTEGNLSQTMKNAIHNITDEQVDQLKNLMRERGKSQQSIDAFEERIQCLKKHVDSATSITDLDEALFALGAET